MARQRREMSKTQIYHVMMRGNERKEIFKDEEDRETFLDILKDKKDRSGYEIYGYCLMGNHIHLLMKEHNEVLSIAMKRINVTYAHYFNKKYSRVGHVFQDRYKSEPIENERHLLAAVRYIHNNPKKAKIVKELKEYHWSSYKDYMNRNLSNGLVDKTFILSMFSSNLEIARELFERFAKEDNKDKFIDIKEQQDKGDIEIKGIMQAKGYLGHYLESRNLTLKDIKNSSAKNERHHLIRHFKMKSDLSIRDMAKLLNVDRGIVSRIKV